MASGYRIYTPAGKIMCVLVGTREEMLATANELIEKWGPYCDRNWLNDTGGVFTPEAKVKRLLDGVGYYLLLGNMDGIETDYYRVLRAKKEIPASNCPSAIDNILYASGGSVEKISVEEEAQFRTMLDELDQKADSVTRYTSRKPRKESLFQKKNRLGIHGGEWVTVDTEGKFWVGNQHYMIDENEIQYQPIETDYGDLYDMDRILVSDGKFYDMNYDEVRVYQIGGLLPYPPNGIS